MSLFFWIYHLTVALFGEGLVSMSSLRRQILWLENCSRYGYGHTEKNSYQRRSAIHGMFSTVTALFESHTTAGSRNRITRHAHSLSSSACEYYMQMVPFRKIRSILVLGKVDWMSTLRNWLWIPSLDTVQFRKSQDKNTFILETIDWQRNAVARRKRRERR